MSFLQFPLTCKATAMTDLWEELGCASIFLTQYIIRFYKQMEFSILFPFWGRHFPLSFLSKDAVSPDVMRRIVTYQYLPISFPPASPCRILTCTKVSVAELLWLLYYRVTESFLRHCLKQDFLILIWMLWQREMPVFQNWISCALIALDLNRNVFTHQS